ncbi:MAG: hypothetical protein K6G26_11320 [Lachnospiraceae bacterium]|nr:hypothetical protein [Lachnospiraceae bacterium]
MKKFIGRKEDVFLLVSIMLVIYSLFYVLLYRENNKQVSSDNSNYKNKMNMLISLGEGYEETGEFENIDIISSVIGDFEDNIHYSIVGLRFNVGNSLEAKDVDLILNKSEKDYSPDTVVAVGKDIKKYCKKTSKGLQMQILNKKCTASVLPEQGILTYYDNRINIYYYNASDKIKAQLKKELINQLEWINIIELSIESDEDLSAYYSKLEERCNSNNITIRIGTKKSAEDNYIDFFIKRMGELFYKIVCVFALVNCVAIGRMWFECHKQEMVIKRAFGYTRNDLYKNVLKTWGRFLGIAFLASETLEIIIGIYNKSILKGTLDFFKSPLLSFVIVFLLVTVIVAWQVQVIMLINIKKLLLK